MSDYRTIGRDELRRIVHANAEVIGAAKELIKVAQKNPELENPELHEKLEPVIDALLRSTTDFSAVTGAVSGLPKFRSGG